MIPFIKVVLTGNSGRKTGHHDDEYYQYQSALQSRRPTWLVHVGGFRLEYYTTLREMRDTNNHRWSQDKTPCVVIKPIRAFGFGFEVNDMKYYVMHA